MAVNAEALRSRTISIRPVVCLVSIAFTLLLICQSGARTDGAPSQADDWITINKDYSSQRYVDLDQITPRNIDKLQEICELRLNEPIFFSTGLLKVGRTLYVNTAHLTAAFDAVTCQVRWRYLIPFKSTAIGDNNRGPAYLDGKIFRGRSMAA
jgi:alcohol dehydrogenase (cytochrome c)